MDSVARARSWVPCWVVVAALSSIALGSLLYAMRVSQTGDVRRLWVFPVAAGIVVFGSIVFRGVRETSFALIATAFLVGSIWQIHAGFRMTYLDGDTAIDTMIYNTTSPDVPIVSRDLEQLSLLALGDRSLSVQIESCSSIDWVFRWTMRDMANTS